jgi:signal transduction histidine kinase
LSERLEAAADVDGLVEAAVAELTTGLDLGEVSVRGSDGTAIAGATAGITSGTTVPLQAYGVTVGSLTYRPPERQLSEAEQRLVRDLARQLGGALHARLLREDLQRARERLVLAREEERRRLRRDLHDGIGPALAGLTLKTETARALLPPGTDGASWQLHSLSEEIRRTVVDVRRLVEGLRPPALDELGLVGACTQAVERLTAGADLAVAVRASDDLPLLPSRSPPTGSWSRRSPTPSGTPALGIATCRWTSPRSGWRSPSPTTGQGCLGLAALATAWPSCGNEQKNSAAR